jgi:putative transcriptional regulator
MMVKKKKISPFAKALLATADDMRKAGLMNKTTHEKITLRLSKRELKPPEPENR